MLPQVYCLPEMVAIGRIRRAALFYAGDGSALSHRTALAVWGLRPAAPDEPIDVPVAGNRRLRNGPGVVIHRRVGSEGLANGTVCRHGLPVVRLERAVVESWPQLDPDERRAPAIVAVRSRRTTAGRLLAAAKQLPKLAGKAELVRLISLLGGGCHSKLKRPVYSRADPTNDPFLFTICFRMAGNLSNAAGLGLSMRGFRFDREFVEYVAGDQRRLQRLAFALTGSREDAEDLVQETLLRLAGGWRRIDQRGPHGYATTVMGRLAQRRHPRGLRA